MQHTQQKFYNTEYTIFIIKVSYKLALHILYHWTCFNYYLKVKLNHLPTAFSLRTLQFNPQGFALRNNLFTKMEYLRISLWSRHDPQSKSAPRNACIDIAEFPWQLIQPPQVGEHSFFVRFIHKAIENNQLEQFVFKKKRNFFEHQMCLLFP